MNFTASYDRTTRIVSAVVVVFMTVVALAVTLAVGSFLAAVVLALVLLAAYAYSPRGYTIEGNAILVKRLIGDFHVALDSLREARAAGENELRGCVRLWGSGGLFGYYGWFRTSQLGTSRWFLTNRGKAVVLVPAGSRPILVSPDDVDGFLGAVRAVAPSVATAVPFGEIRAYPETLNRIPIFLGAGVILAVVALFVVIWTYSPGPPKLTLTAQALTVHDRFYPVTINASTVDVSGIRVVDLSSDSSWRPVMRTNGFANPHYRSGWFRVANGDRVRLYQAHSKNLVLFPPKGSGAPVLLEAADPEALIADVQKEWGGRARHLRQNHPRFEAVSFI